MKKTKLGELIRIQHGYAFKSENYVDKSAYRLLTLGNFADGNSFKYNDAKATYYGADFPEEFILNEGDLVMPLTEQVVGLFGNTAFVPKTQDYKFVLNQRVGKVIFDENKINKYYLHFLLATNEVKQQIEARASGTRQRNISPENVYDVEVIIPNIDIQNRIGNLLYSIELKQISNNRINAELESMAKTVYDYWFTQFDFPDENGKPYKSSGGKMVWNEELKREIPEGWGATTIGSILGDYPKTASILRDDYGLGSKYPIIDQSKDYICGYTDDYDNVLHMNDAIVYGDHTNYTKYVNFDFARGADGTQIINSNEPALPNYILYQQILLLPVIEKGYSRHFKFLKEQYVIVPEFEVSKKYMDMVEYSLLKTKGIITENQQLASLRDWLLPMLMNGQVTIAD